MTHPQVLSDEQIDKLMAQAQVFASAWSLVGGRFDFGNAMEDAEEAKTELRTMLARAESATLEAVRGQAVACVSRSNDLEGLVQWASKRVPVGAMLYLHPSPTQPPAQAERADEALDKLSSEVSWALGHIGSANYRERCAEARARVHKAFDEARAALKGQQ